MTCVPLEIPSAYNTYLFNLRIANHILVRGLAGLKSDLLEEDPTSVYTMVSPGIKVCTEML